MIRTFITLKAQDDIDNINNGSCARQAPQENDYEQEILEIDYLNIYLIAAS